MVEQVAGVIFGVIIGLVAFVLFADIVRLAESRKPFGKPLRWLLALLGGSNLVGMPVAAVILSKAVIPWFIVGEGIAFIPLAVIIILRKYIL